VLGSIIQSSCLEETCWSLMRCQPNTDKRELTQARKEGEVQQVQPDIQEEPLKKPVVFMLRGNAATNSVPVPV